MKLTKDRRLWVARGVFCLLSVLLLSLPAQALADGVLPGGVGEVIDDVTDGAGQAVGDAAGSATEAAGDVIEETTGTVDDVVEETTETVGDVVEETTETVDEVAGEVVGTVDEITDEADAVAGTVGGAANSVAGSSEAIAGGSSGSSDGAGGDGTASVEAAIGSDGVGSGSTLPLGGARWMRREIDRPYFWWDFSGDALGLWVASAQTVEGDTGPNEDPCDSDSQLVCLGLLYGLGDFADTPAQVLGFLATTGIGVFALMILAVGLGLAGSVALVGSRYGTPATVGRTG